MPCACGRLRALLQLVWGSDPLVTLGPGGRAGAFPGSLGTGERGARPEKAAGAGTPQVPEPEGSAAAAVRAGPTREGAGPGPRPARGPGPRRPAYKCERAEPRTRADASRLHLLPGYRSRGSGFSARGAGLRPPAGPSTRPSAGSARAPGGAPTARQPRRRGRARRARAGGRSRFQGGGASRAWAPGPSPPPGPSPRRPRPPRRDLQPRGPGARPLWPQRALAAFELLTFCQLPSDERNENKYFFPWAVAIPVPSTKGGGRGSRRRSGVGRAKPGVYHGPQKRALKTWRLGRGGGLKGAPCFTPSPSFLRPRS